MKNNRRPSPGALRRPGGVVLVTVALVAVMIIWTVSLVFMAPSSPGSQLRAEPATAAPKIPKRPKPVVPTVLHPRTVPMPPLEGTLLSLSGNTPLNGATNGIVESTDSFAQYGTKERGLHYRLRNTNLLKSHENKAQDSVLVIIVLNNHQSWGNGRSSDDFFPLFRNFTHPKQKISLVMLTSSMDEYNLIKSKMQSQIQDYAQFSLLFRNDFNVKSGLTRDNRHDDGVQNVRRRMIARYRNFALLATLETWHQHVLWLDADVHIVPRGLLAKMIQSDRDILEPVCYSGSPPSTNEYDLNAWVGTRTEPKDMKNRKDYVPRNADVRHMSHFKDDPQMEYMPLDSVGGTMLYVKADIHRQGVLFAHHYIIGSEWGAEGYDGIETEGLCYSAHFLGFKCWGMPHDAIYHV